MSAGAKQRLMSEYKALQKEKWVEIDFDEASLFKWTLGLVVINPDSAFSGAYLKAEMQFPQNYPYSPPTFKFLRPIFHPNIYSDGKVCISILHAPGEDEQSGELASERWSPLQGVETVLRSVLLLLDDPEISSPANVDAGVMYRDDRSQYNKRAKETAAESLKDAPEGFVMPTSTDSAPPTKIVDDDAFWAESDAEDDFGASDSSGEDLEMDEYDGEEQDFEESEEDEAETPQ